MPIKHAWLEKDILAIILLLLCGAGLAYLDHALHFHTILVEVVHALIVSAIFIFCLICEMRYPEIKQFGWRKIVWGLAFLMIGSWIDILDDPPTLAWLQMGHIPFGRSWQQAFIKKILGYSAGIGLIAMGFFQWVPWMIENRLNTERLNQKLSQANKSMNRIMMSLDEHVESERLNISRELHDDVAQRLTFVNFQIQWCQKQAHSLSELLSEKLFAMGQEIQESLKSIRQISHDLRPEPLYALGLIPALESFLEKLREQFPHLTLNFTCKPLKDTEPIRLESYLNDRALLHVYRVLQEGVRNAIKHSHAQQMDMIMEETEEAFILQIVDNGRGLPWEEMPSDEMLVQQGHLGVVGLKERVKELQGTFTLSNTLPQGATMEVKIKK